MGYAGPQTFSEAFIPSHGRAKLALIFLWIFIALNALLKLLSTALVFSVDMEAAMTTRPVPSWLMLVGIGLIVGGLSYFVLFILLVVFYLRWQHQAHKNLYALGKYPRFTPGWGVGWWFIPIVQLWKPYQNLKDVGIQSDSTGRGFEPLPWYWFCWIASMIVSSIANNFEDEPTVAAMIDLCALALEIGAAWLLTRYIQFVVEKQPALLSGAQSVRSYR